jgi:hypothetical protein
VKKYFIHPLLALPTLVRDQGVLIFRSFIKIFTVPLRQGEFRGLWPGFIKVGYNNFPWPFELGSQGSRSQFASKTC